MKFTTLLLGLTALTLWTSCSNELDELAPSSVTSDLTAKDYQEGLFPTKDNSTRLATNPALALRQLFTKVDTARTVSLGNTAIEPQQLAEIKAFVDEHLVGKNQYETYRNIFNWIHDNVQYAHTGTAYLDAYDVYIHKRCVCQGYANLLKVMCYTQRIPACIVNGWLSTLGGHAWNYVYCDNKWYVSDPTNYTEYEMLTGINSYKDSLIPQQVDFDLFEDDQFTYSLFDNQFCVTGVKRTRDTYISVPYSKNGFKITMFHPTTEVHVSYNQLYLGSNIESLGNEPQLLGDLFSTLSEIYVDPANTVFESYKNVVYYKGQNYPYFIPNGITRVELKAMPAVDKNTLCNLPNLREVVVADGTKRLEAYAIEACPNLETVYVPEDLEYIDDNAIYKCNDTYQILRVPTGITEVRR